MIESASISGQIVESAQRTAQSAPQGDVQGLILAGSIRTARAQPLARSLGVPIAALPVDVTRTLFSWWIDSLRVTRCVSQISIAISDRSEQVFYERLMDESGVACQVWVDRNEHRGAAGTVRDFFDTSARDSDCGLLVAECSTFADFGLDRLLPEGSSRPQASVLMWTNGQPAGAMYLSKSAIAQIPTIGYFDLKEQLLPALAKRGETARAVVARAEPHRVGNLQGYLQLIAARGSSGEVMVSPDASIHRTAVLQGGVLIGRGVEIGAGAVVSSSVVMSSARIASGAIVARAVVPPGASIQAGARVIDQVYASLDAGGREGR